MPPTPPEPNHSQDHGATKPEPQPAVAGPPANGSAGGSGDVSAADSVNDPVRVKPEHQGEDLLLPGVELSQAAAQRRFERLPASMQGYVLDRKRRLLQKYPGALEPGFVPPEDDSIGGRVGLSLNAIANIFIFLACFIMLAYFVHVDYGLNIFEVLWESLLKLLDPGFDAQRQAAVEGRHR